MKKSCEKLKKIGIDRDFWHTFGFNCLKKIFIRFKSNFFFRTMFLSRSAKSVAPTKLEAIVHFDDCKEKGVIELQIPEYNMSNISSLRPKLQLLLVVDTSYSMQSPAVCKGENGEDLNKGWSNLDINIHGILTVIGMMNDGDKLCIIDFASDAIVVLDWTDMNESGRNTADAAIRRLEPRGGTNLTSAM